MGEGAADLARLVASEFDEPAPAAAARLATEFGRRHGDAVAAVLFYGSCLRKRTSEGVLDFYVLVDSYRSAYRSRALAWANALLPPNVFYLELELPEGTVRAKYAVVSMRDFERGAGPGSLRSSIWARFCQPAIAVSVRDAQAKEAVVGFAVQSILTAMVRIVPLLPASGDVLRFRFGDLWQRALRETYAAELRTEVPETIRRIYLTAPERYDRAARYALDELDHRNWLRLRSEDDQIEVTMEAWRRRRARLAWRLRRPLAKLVYLVGLLKSTATFEGWLAYVLWKLERQTGTRLVPSERQRRHPLLLAWPLLVRVLWRRDLR